MRCCARAGRETVSGEQEDTRCSQGEEPLAGTHDAGADRTRCIIARTACHDHSRREPPGFGHRRAQLACRGIPFHQARHIRFAQTGSSEHFARPAAAAHIQPESSGGIRHIRHRLAGHPQSQVVLGQQNLRQATRDFRFMFLHPQNLRRSETGERQVPGNLGETRLPTQQFLTLGSTSTIVPEDRWSEHMIGIVQKRGPVHLPGEADGLRRRECLRCRRPQSGDAFFGSAPPILGILLGEERFGSRHRQGDRSLSQHFLTCIDQQ